MKTVAYPHPVAPGQADMQGINTKNLPAKYCNDYSVLMLNGDATAEIALNVMTYLMSLYYAAIIKTRCPPASPGSRRAGRWRAGPWYSALCDMARVERKKRYSLIKDRQDFVTRLAALAEDKSMDIYGWVLLPIPLKKKYL